MVALLVSLLHHGRASAAATILRAAAAPYAHYAAEAVGPSSLASS
jgi:hypothetical protein